MGDSDHDVSPILFYKRIQEPFGRRRFCQFALESLASCAGAPMYTHARLRTIFLGFFAARILSQQEAFLKSGPYSLRGHVIVRDSQSDGILEVKLFRDINREIASVNVYSSEWFRFRGLSAGTYFVVVNTPGFEIVRQRVDVGDVHGETFLTIFVESKIVQVRSPGFSIDEYEDNIMDVREFLSPALSSEYERAMEDFNNADYDAAQTRLEQIAQSSPGSYDAHKYLGMAYQKLDLFEKAEAAYEAASVIRPASIVPLLLLGNIYFLEAATNPEIDVSTKRLVLAEGIENLAKAVRLEPNATLAHYILGLLYFEAAFYEEAEESLLRTLELEPRLSRANLALANVYIRIEKWQDALARIDTFMSSNTGEVSQEVLEIRSRIEMAVSRGMTRE
jgi:tetratricopeptide (TPR) repeat protein